MSRATALRPWWLRSFWPLVMIGSARPFLQAWGAQQRQPIQSLNVWFLCRYWASGILRTCTPYLVPISSFMYRSTFRLPVSWKTNVLIMILNPYSFISYSISYPFGAFVPIKHPSFAGFIQFPLWSCRERIVTGMALESCNWEGKSHLGSLLKVNPTWQSVRWNCIFILEM